MNNEVSTIAQPSVIQDMANRFGMDKRAFEATIKQTCMPAKVEVTTEQFVAFLLVAKQYNLNPITKEIFAFPARNGGIQPVVGVDGWCNIINSRPELNGIEFEDRLDDKGKLTAITCRIYRKDRAKPVETTEYMSECAQKKDTWEKWPARMLRHKALIQCARYAFGFSGLVDPDEAERAIEQSTDVTPYNIDVTKKKSPFKTAALRNSFIVGCIAAYRAAQTPKEINTLKTMDSVKMAEMEASGDDRDTQGLGEINKHIQIALQRVSIPIVDNTPAEDTGTFEDDDTPPFVKQQMQDEKDRLAALGNY